MNRLEEIIKTLKTHIGEGVEVALDYLEKILDHSSARYNDYIQIKSRYNSLQRELLLGVLDHSTYDISRNNISKALLLLAEEITEKDLIPEGGPAASEDDKRGEILYDVPDLMQLNREEKCTVRIAFEAQQLWRDWEKSDSDVLKSIRVSEIMAVSLLNVDETDPPFTIRTFSETVQFVDRDDYTEWVFYVKPLKTGRFPLVLRVSVIEMINNKEYKKDIVLEEEITVQTEAPQPAEANFKSAGASISLTNTPIGPQPVAPPAAQVQEAAKKGARNVVGALLTVAALAAGGYFGFQVYDENRDWNEARKSGGVADYEKYIADHPGGRHREEAVTAIDSLRASRDTLPETSGSIPREETDQPAGSPVDTSGAVTTAEPSSGAGTPTEPAGNTPGRTGKKPGKTGKKDKPAANPSVPVQPAKPAGSVTPAATGNPPAPSVPTQPLLRGNALYFKMPRFAVVESDAQEIFFTFYQFNQYREVLVMLSSIGDAKVSPGMTVALIPSGGEIIQAEVKYVAVTPQAVNRSDWYFTLDADALTRLANERFKAVRLFKPGGQSARTYTFTGRGSKRLSQKAAEALKKLDEK